MPIPGAISGTVPQQAQRVFHKARPAPRRFSCRLRWLDEKQRVGLFMAGWTGMGEVIWSIHAQQCGQVGIGNAVHQVCRPPEDCPSQTQRGQRVPHGRNRGGAAGVVSLLQTSTKQGKRSSTYRAFLEGDVERRTNLTIITGAQVTQVLLDDSSGQTYATGVRYLEPNGEIGVAFANKEVILSAGAVGSPHLLLLSGIGPRHELEAVGLQCIVDSPDVGKHLTDHIQVPLFFSAPRTAISMSEIVLSMGPGVLRQPSGPLTANPVDDEQMPAELQALKQESERRLA